MAISVNWATKVIYIPKADLTVVQLAPSEIYELSIDFFRLTLKDLEDNVDGMTFPTTHNHNPPITVGGVTLARVVEIINDYTVTFEDGQYAVNLIGANSNIADRVNVNQVSVRSANSAGLVQTAEIEHASFNGHVTIDVVNGVAGTIYPTGTPTNPVNNIEDALLIATRRGFDIIEMKSDLTITSGQDISGYTLRSDNFLILTINTGAIVDNTIFEKVSLYGVMSGVWNIIIDCWVYDISNFIGWVRGGSIGNIAIGVGDPGAEFGSQVFFDDLVPLFPGVTSVVTMNTNITMAFTNCKDIVTIASMVAGTSISCGLLEGKLIAASSCTGGNIVVSGVGNMVDNTPNNSDTTIDTTGLVNQDTIAVAVWDEPLTGATHNIPTSAGRKLRQLGQIVIREGVAQGPGTGNNQIQLDTGSANYNGAYDPAEIAIIAGTGIGQSRLILQYEGATRIATVDRDWKVLPNNTSEFIIYVNSGREHVNEGLAQGGTANTITLNADASSTDMAYNGQTIFLRSGTGQDQVGHVIDYDGTTKIATIHTAMANNEWAIIPDSTTGYVMLPQHFSNTGSGSGGLTTEQATQLANTVKKGDVILNLNKKVSTIL